MPVTGWPCSTFTGFVCLPGPVPYVKLQRPCSYRHWNKHPRGPALDHWASGAAGWRPGWTLHSELGPRRVEDFRRRNLRRCQLQERPGHATLQRAGTCERGTRALLAQQGCCPLLCPVWCDRTFRGRGRDRWGRRRRRRVADWMLASAGGQWKAAVAPRAVETPRRTRT